MGLPANRGTLSGRCERAQNAGKPRLEPGAAGLVGVSASLQSIVLRCRVMPPFAELRQTLLVDAIDLGLHLRMPALDQDGEFPPGPERNQSNRISSAGRLANTSANADSASLRGITRHPPTTQERECKQDGLADPAPRPAGGARVLKSTGGKPKTPTLSRTVGFCVENPSTKKPRRSGA